MSVNFNCIISMRCVRKRKAGYQYHQGTLHKASRNTKCNNRVCLKAKQALTDCREGLFFFLVARAFALGFETPHYAETVLCITVSTDAEFLPQKRLKPLPQQGFHGLHLFWQLFW